MSPAIRNLLLLSLSLSLLPLAPVVEATVSFANEFRNITASFDSLAYFQQSSTAADAAASLGDCVLIEAVAAESGCRFDQPLQQPASASARPRTATCTGIFVDVDFALTSGCSAMPGIAQAVERDILPFLTQAQLPASAMLLMVLPRLPSTDMVPGGPVTTPYLPLAYAVTDRPPRTPTVLLTSEAAQQFSEQFRMVRTVYVSAQPQPGPWNAVFMSGGYVAFQWTLFALNTLTIIIALVQFSAGVRSRSVVLDKRLGIFLLGVVSTTLFSITLTQRKTSRAYVICDALASTIFAVGFYMLLLLWSAVLAQVQRQCGFRPLRLGIFLAIFISVYTQIVLFVWLGAGNSAAAAGLNFSTRVAMPTSQLAIALLFLYYAIRFQRRKAATSSEHTKRALARISWLAILGFVTFIAKATANLVASSSTMAGNVGAITTSYILVDVCGFLRVLSILLVLGVRLPASKGIVTTGKSSQQTGSYGSSADTMVSDRRATTMTQIAKPQLVLPRSIRAETETAQLIPALYGEPLPSPGNVTRMSLRPYLHRSGPKRVSSFGWVRDNGLVQVGSDDHPGSHDQYTSDDGSDYLSVNSSQSPTSWRL